MRKVILGLALAAALVAPGVSAAHNPSGPPGMICGRCDNGGTGWTGCAQITASESGGVSYIAHWRHYLVVNFCKRNGTITSLAIVAHGCDSQGFADCSPGPAWLTSGGVGYGWASVEGHATYAGTLAGSPFRAVSVVHADVAIG
jgi:hypothetical protein